MRLDRRHMLSLMALGAAAPLEVEAATAEPARFLHGVASGDPLSDRAILWTRATPESGQPAAVALRYSVFEDAALTRKAAMGRIEARRTRDYTAKVDVTGLKPARDYWYVFETATGVRSPVGRLRTLPVGSTDKVVLAFVTCALYPAGYFNAYADIARAGRIDAVVELGDYIYEYGAKPDDYGMEAGRRLGRIPEPAHDLVTLADYRTRHAQYKRDPDQQAAHARCAWICVWDDHEVANDDWTGGAENHRPATEGDWHAREQAAIQAYYEWMPIREPQAGRPFEAINRSFQFGDLASLIMLETRLLARSYQLEYDRPQDIPLAPHDVSDPAHPKKVTDAALAAQLAALARAGKPLPAPYAMGQDVAAIEAVIGAPDRQLMGPAQEAWFAAELKASVAAGKPWQVLGNQVVMAKMINPNIRAVTPPAQVEAMVAALPQAARAEVVKTMDLFSYPAPFDFDGWNGYPAARERAYAAIKASGGGNTLVFSGDSHAFWANQLHDAAGRPVAAEFGTSSVTSPSLGDEAGGVQLGPVFTAQNKEVLFCDQLAKGYIRLTLTHDQAVADYIEASPLQRTFQAKTLASFRVRPGANTAIEKL